MGAVERPSERRKLMSIVNLDRDLQQAIYREKAQELYELWLGSPKAKQLGTIDAPVFSFIREFLAKNYNGIVCVEGLDLAVDALLAHRLAEAEKVAAQLRLADQIEDYMLEHKISQDDQAITVIAELQKDSAFSFDNLVRFVEMFPEKFNHLQGFKAYDLLTAVRRADKTELVRLRQRYGDDRVTVALNQLAARIHKGSEKGQDVRAYEGVSNTKSSYSPADAEADQRRRQEEFKKSPLYKIQQAGLKQEAEHVVFSFRVCIGGNRTDHGATQFGRQVLQQLLDQGVAAGTPWNVLRDELRSKATELAG
jgi:hypothetical protein